MPEPDPNLISVFSEALERSDPAERAAYLDRACEGNAELRQRVEALLAAHGGAGRFLEPDSFVMSDRNAPETEAEPSVSVPMTHPPSQPMTEEHGPGGAIATLAGQGRTDRASGFVAGQVIAGRYTLVEFLGEGGMGTVYRASQTEPVRRQVALKLIKLGMDSRVVLARFDAERQALALMDHPNIARVYDGGSTAGGQPFFVMELVNGVPITEYCDRMRLSVRTRLELLVAVCQAVQHAHQKGIIHRDLKPSNVLVGEVDGRATPKVIDFGVAKAIEFKLTQESLADTGAIVGTPTYMSPEQADPSSMDIDTRTDIYALGVILYELLAGSPPLDSEQFRRGAILEMLRMVREVDPPRPSTKVSTADALPNIAASRNIEPAQLKRALKGDLDWIVMKALEKDRARRYETANGFAADVLRHLSSEPVLAAPPSRGYRLRKFARKHRGPLAAAGLVFLALLAGIVGTAWQAVRASAARQRESERAAGEAAAKQDALRVGEQLRAARDELQVSLYAARSNLIEGAWEGGDIGRVRELLGEQVPKAGERDLRGFEWHYWDRLAHAELRVVPLHQFRGMGKFSVDASTLIGLLKVDKEPKMFTIKIGYWDAGSGRLLQQIQPYTAEERARIGNVGVFSFTPDGAAFQQGATEAPQPGSPQERVPYFWDAAAGKRLHRIAGLGPYASEPALVGGKRLLWLESGPREKVKPRLHARDLNSGRDLYALDLPCDDVEGMSVSRDGATLAAILVFSRSPKPAEVHIWSVADGKLRASCGPVEPTQSTDSEPWVVLSPDARRVAAGFRHIKIPQPMTVWDAATGKKVFREEVAFSDSPIFSPDGSLLAAASRGSSIEVRDAATGKLRHTFRGHTGVLWDIGFSADGTKLYSCGSDETVRIWDATGTDSGDPIALSGAAWARMLSGASGDGTRFATRAEQRPGASKAAVDTIAVWNASGKRLATLEATLDHKWHSDFFPNVALDWNGRRVAFSDGKDVFADGRSRPEGQLCVWDVATGKPLIARARWGRFHGCALSPDGVRVASIFVPEDDSAAAPVTVWDVETGQELQRFELKPVKDARIAFSPDGNRVVAYQFADSGKRDVVTSWDVHRGERMWEIASPTLGQQLGLLVQSPDGRRIARSYSSVFSPGLVEVLDAESGHRVCILRGHSGPVVTLRFSPDCRRIATSDFTQVKVWDAESGRALVDLTRPGGHNPRVLTFTADGDRLLALARDESGIAIVQWDGTLRPGQSRP